MILGEDGRVGEPSSKDREPGIFENMAEECDRRLNRLYDRFHLNDLRVLPDPNKDEKFKILSQQRGTREWLALRLKTLEGMVSQASNGDERTFHVLERALSQWENVEDRKVLIEPNITPRETGVGDSQLAA